MNLRRGLVVAITLSTLAIPAYILASNDTPPVALAVSTTNETSELENKIANVAQVKESVDKFCDVTPTNLEKVAKKNNIAGEGLVKFNQNISAVKTACNTIKAFDPNTIKKAIGDENLNNYKKQAGGMLINAQAAIDELGVK